MRPISQMKLWDAVEDDLIQNKLIFIASRHVKLALEFGKLSTSVERKQEIQKEVQLLRLMRNELLQEANSNK